jgi:S1-C subfamily serine protease
VKHRNFPKQQMDEFLKKFPDARNKVVSVQYTISGSTSEGIIKPGDIIWEINGTPLGGDLAILDNEMDKASDSAIKLTIYRDGEKIDQMLQVYDINSNKINNMINFAGALFF